MRKLAFFLPLALFLGLAVFLFSGLFSNPMERESSVLNKPLPVFSLPDLNDPAKSWTADSLKGKPLLLNVWGVWCPTCNAELAYLSELREQGVTIVGLYYEQPADAAFGEVFDLARLQQDVALKLSQNGNPYQWNILDKERSLIFDLGVTGAPETFLIDKNGVVRYHHIGDINPQLWQQKLAAQWQALQE
ncbi:DsbE family thiol:disulfide interchange protein [Rheinheimera sp.]|uniref:DsbE family thiol:disulfide interchange protein n=1 Tax=Rheinheimera sp. TaxID=1869214 RepID=UPI003AF612A2